MRSGQRLSVNKSGIRRAIVLAELVAGATLALPANAAANEPRQPEAPIVMPALSITPDQVAAFANLLDEPVTNVERRLLWDPGLASLAVAAVDARASRQKAGRNMTIAGFTLMGGGITAGLVVAMSGLCFGESSECRDKTAKADRDFEIVIGLSAAIGLLIAVPGIIKMARQSDAENQAQERYRRPRMERPRPLSSETPRPWKATSSGKSPPLSLSFAF